MRAYTTFAKRFIEMKIADERLPGGAIDGSTDNTEDVEHWKDCMMLSLNMCKIFEVTNEEKKMMLLTKPPKNKNLKLPFDQIFIDVELTQEEVKHLLDIYIPYPKIVGIMISKRYMFFDGKEEYFNVSGKSNGTTMKPCAICRKTAVHHEFVLPKPNQHLHICMDCADATGYSDVMANKSKLIGTYRVYEFFCEDNSTKNWKDIKNLRAPFLTFKFFSADFEFIDGHDRKIDPKTHVPSKVRKMLIGFTKNILQLVTDPEVELVPYPRSVERDRKRARRGKPPIPDRMVIKLKGKLKHYMDSVARNEKLFTYSHRFWVMGHWRHYRHPKWGERVGTAIWINAYVKGEGMLIDRRYKIDKR